MYEEFYGLTHKPFQLSPDPKFFFASDHHKKALSYLKYGLGQQEGFIVITGPIGTGKSTLARNMLNEVDGSNIVAAQLVTTMLDPAELLEMIAIAFGLEPADKCKSTILQAIENYLVSLYRQGKRAVLLVDEAQNLPQESVEELRMLSNFQIDNRPLFQSFLLGQDELRDIIRAPGMEQFRQRIIASSHLQALSQEETRDYIQHRLKQAGLTDRELISFAAYSVIHGQTQGIPRKINLFMDRLMLFGYLEELHTFNIEAIDAVIEEMSNELNMGQGGSSSASSPTAPSTAGPGPRPGAPMADPMQLLRLETLVLQSVDKLNRLEAKVDRLLTIKSQAETDDIT